MNNEPSSEFAGESFASAGPRPITNADLERVAEEEGVCAFSVLRAYAGIEIRGRAGGRARRAAARLRSR